MLFISNWLDRMEYKFRRYSIRNLMTIIIFGMAFIFIMDMARAAGAVNMPVPLSYMLYFDWRAVLSGEVWRIVSFVFIPPLSGSALGLNFIFIIFTLYFYWLVGSTLENYWGTFKFNVFYFSGVIGTIIGGIIAGSIPNDYLNLSLFLAFAILHPNFELLIFFMIPVKIKYLAYLETAFLLFALFTASIPGKVAIAASLINLILFFGGDFISRIKQTYRRAKWKRDAGTWFR